LGGVPVNIGDVSVNPDSRELLEEEETELLSDTKPPGVPAFLVKCGHHQTPHTQVIRQEYGDVTVTPCSGVIDLSDEETEEENEREVSERVETGGSSTRGAERGEDVVSAEQDCCQGDVVNHSDTADTW
jgi:hypothetical protein